MIRFLTTLILFLGLAAGPAWAQSYPSKPITYLFPFSPGPGDATVRSIFDKFRERTGQPIVIDFRPGAQGIVGATAMLRAPTDGYTIGFTGALLTGALTTTIVPFTLDDFSFITQFGQMMKGVLDLASLLFFASLIACCLVINALLVDLEKAA